MTELYSFDKYKGHKIFIEEENHKYYATIQWNGTTVKELSGTIYEKLKDRCWKWIETQEDQ